MFGSNEPSRDPLGLADLFLLEVTKLRPYGLDVNWISVVCCVVENMGTYPEILRSVWFCDLSRDF